MWQSECFSLQTTSFDTPAGVLQSGVDYVYGIILGDYRRCRSYAENSSKAFSEPFRFAVPGDYNGNGTVGPEDYDLWKANFGSTTFPAADGNGDGIVNAGDYTVWRNHLGDSLGAGGGAAVPSVAPLSPAVPEPATFVPALVAIGPRRPSRRSFCPTSAASIARNNQQTLQDRLNVTRSVKHR